MNLLLVVSNYPNAGHPYSGAFNERSAQALKSLGHQVEVLAPRPYIPAPLARWHARWRAYADIPAQEVRGGISVYRPAYLQIPGCSGALRPDLGAFLSCGARVNARHGKRPYDAILAFNLIGAGGLAWRLARRLGIPAAGWATGNDVRVAPRSAHGRAVRATLQRLDLLFFQSAELLERAAALSEVPAQSFIHQRGVVLPRGVEVAPPPSAPARNAKRRELDVGADELLVLFVGRLVRAKGIFELLEAMRKVREARPDVVCALLGAHEGFDDTVELRARLDRFPDLAHAVRLLPACAPEMVWDYFFAADIFAFPSHSEGMPNSLLEAMGAGLPAIACDIPAVREIDDGAGILEIVPLRDPHGLARAVIDLATSPERRRRLIERGKARVHARFQIKNNMAEAVRRLSTVLQVDADAVSMAAPAAAGRIRPM